MPLPPTFRRELQPQYTDHHLSQDEVLKHIETIVKVNPDTTEDEIEAFIHLLGYGDAYVENLMA